MSALFSPIKLAGLELPNRIVVSPMCQYSANDGCANDWHLMHLGMLANSGASLVMVEATHVERHGRITHGCMGLYSDDNEAALARVVASARRTGTAKFGIQLAHAGRKASSQRPWEGGGSLKPDADPWSTIAPSALPYGENWQTPREATEADLEAVRAAFVSSAQRALRIGFDAIELHMAHGYLAHSFMSPVSNKRTDQYGGSFENRLRFPLSIAKAVRATVPKHIPLGARMTGSDWRPDGITPDDAVKIAKALKGEGLDYVCVSSGGIAAETRTPTTPGYNVPIAARVKAETGIATRTVGLITAPEQAEKIVGEGQADQVSLARAFLDDPHWGWHAAKALGAEITRPPQYARAGPKMWAPAAAAPAKS
jgi:2,4-dienoyl-CoA reductase-like NADH-dependent reductase (Old Yellow Enzyme family)